MKTRDNYKIMVVDDDASVRESLCHLLRNEGYQVALAANGVEAIETFRREQNGIDLMLIDLNMPLRNGWAAMDRLLEARLALPVIIITGQSDQEDMAREAGVSALVEKPIDVPALLQLIHQRQSEPAQELSFRHLFSAHVAGCLEVRQNAAPYNHWGLNE